MLETWSVCRRSDFHFRELGQCGSAPAGISTSMVRSVCIVGGTHGNERHGVHMVRHYQEHSRLIERKTFTTSLLIANPMAVANKGTGAGTRYVDEDLNRCFLKQTLASAESATSVEGARAREINQILGPKASPEPACDFIFDLHNTTSNTGILLCYHPTDKLSYLMSEYLFSKNPHIRVCLWPEGDRQVVVVPLSCAHLQQSSSTDRGQKWHDSGGSAVSHSTVHAKKLMETMEVKRGSCVPVLSKRQLIQHGLDFIDMFNMRMEELGASADFSVTDVNISELGKVPIFTGAGKIDYPRDSDGNIIGFIHPNLQGIAELQEGSTIQEGDDLFQAKHFISAPCSSLSPACQMLDGSVRPFVMEVALKEAVGNAALYPLFVNEAAYYEQGSCCLPSLKHDTFTQGLQ
ncbi:hypothetical protein GUITHDRAFT_118300 [Guillardia theta CCMP2712]|uniref:Succinylglutamate desuccinylase/Aspartoacylase catalytic domain-containing protein n=1 Tax=Guillardia theta (strain CCMP2712) TaxID=905079 RepID=L1IGU8_GUITC|nr:hypothetical protein GUITHDRAFT_118300 [Guillardia theta CCMP2712]EKX35486.1 hypothetical protein GUITHDRAFT_118300 [Guillardia theta CCMP2712]|eukprot:XP_005822466.1 hypothetical protein GUITHDRAFT_118300 [Guillardia theta CCMP2712]